MYLGRYGFVTVDTAAPRAHLPKPIKLRIPCFISGDAHQKHKASILTSPFKLCLHPHLTTDYQLKGSILVYSTQKAPFLQT